MKQRNATIAGLLLRKGCIGAKTKVLSKKKEVARMQVTTLGSHGEEWRSVFS
jgi:hypothetical protein